MFNYIWVYLSLKKSKFPLSFRHPAQSHSRFVVMSFVCFALGAARRGSNLLHVGTLLSRSFPVHGSHFLDFLALGFSVF